MNPFKEKRKLKRKEKYEGAEKLDSASSSKHGIF